VEDGVRPLNIRRSYAIQREGRSENAVEERYGRPFTLLDIGLQCVVVLQLQLIHLDRYYIALVC
jgi:hypothetical protein